MVLSCLRCSIHLSLIHSFHVSPPSFLINCVYSKIPMFRSSRSQHSQYPNQPDRDTVFFILSILQPFLHLAFQLSLIITLVLSHLLSSSSSVCLPTVGTHYLSLFCSSSTFPPSSSCESLYFPFYFCRLSVITLPSFIPPLLLTYTYFHPLALVFNVIILLISSLFAPFFCFYLTLFFLYFFCFVIFSIPSHSW